ncbi:MAG: archaellin/type IV pilin N-terminal domain-containing protein [Candidatus Pacearchaeota archaeon]
MDINKRGISPAIATVLLISIVVILGIIIFLASRALVKEEVEKFGEPAKRICEEISFSATYYGGEIEIVNNAQRVPIHKIKFFVKDGSKTMFVDYSSVLDIQPGRSRSIDYSLSYELKGIAPVILGKKSGATVEYLCNNKLFTF